MKCKEEENTNYSFWVPNWPTKGMCCIQYLVKIVPINSQSNLSLYLEEKQLGYLWEEGRASQYESLCHTREQEP